MSFTKIDITCWVRSRPMLHSSDWFVFIWTATCYLLARSFSFSNVWLQYCWNTNQLECGPMPNVMTALQNIGGALCSAPQSLADAHY